jgi:hypothetical protein
MSNGNRTLQAAGRGAPAVEAPTAVAAVSPLPRGGYLSIRQQPPNAWVLQRHGADGQPVDAGATVNAAMAGDAWPLGVAPLAGGGYAAVWLELVQFERFGGSAYRLVGQTFWASGAPASGPVPIGETRPGLYWYPRPLALPRVAALTGGQFVVVWGESHGSGVLAVHARRINPDGTPAGAVRQVAPEGSGYLGVIGLDTGGYLVTWGTFGGPSGGARAYGADDVPLGPAQPAGPSWFDFPVNGGEAPLLAALAGGGAVMVWLRESAPRVRVQHLAPDATSVFAGAVVDDAGAAAAVHGSPAVGALPDRGYVVAWTETGEVHARRFAAGGAPAGPATRIDMATTPAQPPVTVVALPAGGFRIAWSVTGPDGLVGVGTREFPGTGLQDPP